MEEKFMTRKNDGITLIALVITIIVLLILAGVTIATLMGDNGILSKATEAKVENRAGEVEEKVAMWISEKEAGKYVEWDSVDETELLNQLKKDKLILSDEEIDSENKTINIGNHRPISYALKTNQKTVKIYADKEKTELFIEIPYEENDTWTDVAHKTGLVEVDGEYNYVHIDGRTS